MILVMRCADTLPLVESVIVQCHHCGEDCWLSKEHGEDITRIGRFFGDPRYVCSKCYDWEIGL